MSKSRLRAAAMVAVLALVAALVATVGVGGSTQAGAAQTSQATAAAPASPNVVLFLLDDMRPDEMRFLPRTSRWMSRNGVHYRNAYSPHPLCCPARAEMFVGQYAQNNGVKNNRGSAGGFPNLRDPDDNVGSWLQAQGYHTSFIGKFLNGYRKVPLGNGEYYPTVAGWNRWDPLVKDIYDYRRGTFFNGDRFRNSYVTGVLRQRARKAVVQAEGSPFLVWLNHTAPHASEPRRGGQDVPSEGSAWGPPRYERKYAKAYRSMRPDVVNSPAFNEDISDLPEDMTDGAWFDRKQIVGLSRARARALRSTDDSIMRTINDLKRAGRLKNTYVVFTSDNGYHLGEHRYKGKNLMFDASLRVPLYVSGPARSRGTDDTPVTLLDVVASIADWTGSTSPRGLDGIPLDRAGQRDTILIQAGNSQRTEDDFWGYRGVRTERYLYAAPPGGGPGVLFDTRRDPHQLQNRFGDFAYRAVQDELAERTQELADCAGQSCNQTFGSMPQPLVLD